MTTAEERRQQVLDDAGWGDRPRVVQPGNPVFWLAAAICGWGLLLLWQSIGRVAEISVALVAVVGVVAVVALMMWGWWLRRMDRFGRMPLSIVAVAVLWGATAATFAMAVPGNSALGSLYVKWFGQVFASDWGAGLSAPLVEETAKGLGIIVVMALAPRLTRTPTDGMVLGAFIGLGFQASEDMLYMLGGGVQSIGSGSNSDLLGTIIVRLVSDVVSHPLFSAMFGAGIVYLVGSPVQPRRVVRGIGFVVAALGIHGVWDASTALAGGTGLGAVVLLGDAVFALSAVAIAFRVARRVDAVVVDAVLAPEVDSGVVPADLAAAVVSRRAQRTWVRRGGSREERHARRARARAVLDLVEDLSGSAGTESAAVAASREIVVGAMDHAGGGSSAHQRRVGPS